MSGFLDSLERLEHNLKDAGDEMSGCGCNGCGCLFGLVILAVFFILIMSV